MQEPDEEHILHGEGGLTYYRFVASYEKDGESWTMTFWATDMLDAEEHVLSMVDTMQLDGQLLSTDNRILN